MTNLKQQTLTTKTLSRELKTPRRKITVRPTGEQLARLHERATRSGYKSLARYLVERGLSEGTSLTNLDAKRVEQLLFEVRRVGRNVNQIALKLNLNYEGYSQQQLDEAMLSIVEIVGEIKGELA